MSNSLKQKTIRGIKWSFIEKISIRLGQFISGVFLARILSPSDFGTIAMLSIFIAVATSLIESGLGRSLIQKQNCSETEFSSAFTFNVFLSIILYALLYFFSPVIAKFYNTPDLTQIIRVFAFSLILQAFTIVPNAKLSIKIDFKRIANISVWSVIIGSAAGIISALNNLGLWALVIQTLTRSLISCLLYLNTENWRISFNFSFVSLKSLFRYGSNLLLASIISEILNNIYNLVIGKFHLSSELGAFNRSKTFTNLSSDTISQAIQQVTFPVLSSIQTEKQKTVEVFKKIIKASAFICFPTMTLLSLLAEPLIRVLLTDKWLMVIPLLQWMAFSRILYPISAANLNFINAIGRSDLFLKTDLFKFSYIFIIMSITIPLGIKAMIIGQVINAVLAFLVNTYIPGRHFNFGALKQFIELTPYIFASLIMAITVYYSLDIFKSMYLKLFTGVVIGLTTYYCTCLFMNINEIKEVNNYFSKIKTN